MNSARGIKIEENLQLLFLNVVDNWHFPKDLYDCRRPSETLDLLLMLTMSLLEEEKLKRIKECRELAKIVEEKTRGTWWQERKSYLHRASYHHLLRRFKKIATDRIVSTPVDQDRIDDLSDDDLKCCLMIFEMLYRIESDPDRRYYVMVAWDRLFDEARGRAEELHSAMLDMDLSETNGQSRNP